MQGKPQIHIPVPCHENWQNMPVTDKGRFCVSCHKNVIDFTQLSDRQIAAVFKKEGNVCGRFLNTQLERDLVIPKEKSPLWMAASAAVVAFFTLGNYKVFAQKVKAETVQVENHATNTAGFQNNRIINGTVTDTSGIPILGANLKNLHTANTVQTDFDGAFSIEAKPGEKIEISFIGMETHVVTVDKRVNYEVKLADDISPETISMVGGAFYQRSFFGRIFHSIGNLFR